MNRDTLRRFAYIETCLYWGGGVNASQIAETFEITRQNAQKCLDAYRALYANQMQYNASLKRHIGSESFTPHYISVQPEQYLDYMRGSQLAAYYWLEDEWGGVRVVDVDRLFRTHLDREVVYQIINAISNHLTLLIDYHSKSQLYHLTISPNRLVYVSRRYHVRSYCHNWQKYIDIVLSRVFKTQLDTEEWVDGAADQEWHSPLTLYFMPNPELPEQLRQTLLIDHRSKLNDASQGSAILTIQTCKALKAYVMREMERVDWRYKMRLWLLVGGEKL